MGLGAQGPSGDLLGQAGKTLPVGARPMVWLERRLGANFNLILEAPSRPRRGAPANMPETTPSTVAAPPPLQGHSRRPNYTL